MQFNVIQTLIPNVTKSYLPGLYFKHPSFPVIPFQTHLPKLTTKNQPLLLLAQFSPETYPMKVKGPKHDLQNLLSLAAHSPHSSRFSGLLRAIPLLAQI